MLSRQYSEAQGCDLGPISRHVCPGQSPDISNVATGETNFDIGRDPRKQRGFDGNAGVCSAQSPDISNVGSGTGGFGSVSMKKATKWCFGILGGASVLALILLSLPPTTLFGARNSRRLCGSQKKTTPLAFNGKHTPWRACFSYEKNDKNGVGKKCLRCQKCCAYSILVPCYLLYNVFCGWNDGCTNCCCRSCIDECCCDYDCEAGDFFKSRCSHTEMGNCIEYAKGSRKHSNKVAKWTQLGALAGLLSAGTAATFGVDAVLRNNKKTLTKKPDEETTGNDGNDKESALVDGKPTVTENSTNGSDGGSKTTETELFDSFTHNYIDEASAPTVVYLIMMILVASIAFFWWIYFQYYCCYAYCIVESKMAGNTKSKIIPPVPSMSSEQSLTEDSYNSTMAAKYPIFALGHMEKISPYR